MTNPELPTFTTDSLVSLPNPVLSKQRLDALQEVAEHLRVDMPEYLGMTVFGSTVRGEARTDSDVDMCVFVKAGEGEGEVPAHKIAEGMMSGTYAPDSPIYLINTKLNIKSLVASTLGTKSDVEITPINKTIVADTVEILMSTSAQYREGAASFEMPRNVHMLFHVPVDTDMLHPFIEQVIRTLSDDGRGEYAWEAIRHFVGAFETGRDTHPSNIQHRYVPTNLEEARAYYLHE